MRTAACLVLFAAAPAAADAIDNLAPGEWYEVPNSKLSAVAPNPVPPGNSGVSSVMDAWSGGAYDAARDRLLVSGGGHTDYAGNEVYAFDLQKLSWSRIWGPTPDNQIPEGAGFESYDDGNPSARHTYAGLAYVPAPIDAYFMVGGSRWQNGYGTAAAWRLDLASSTWSRRADHLGNVNFGDATLYDPMTGHLFHRGLTVLDEYDPAADQWTQLVEEQGGWWTVNTSGAIAPAERLIVVVGSGELFSYRIDTGKATYPQPSTGGDSLVGTDAPGIDYDPTSKLFVAWGGGGDVWSLDPSSWSWTRNAAAGAVAPPAAQPTGTFGRFRYVPTRNVFVLANDVDQDVFVYRFAKGLGTPQDLGAPGLPDAAARPDGARGPDLAASPDVAGAGGGEAGGCGCAIGARRPSGGGPLLLAAIAGLTVSLRRPRPTKRARAARTVRRLETAAAVASLLAAASLAAALGSLLAGCAGSGVTASDGGGAPDLSRIRDGAAADLSHARDSASSPGDAATDTGFAALCSAPGVLRCIDFDTDAEFAPAAWPASGLYPAGDGVFRGIRDTAVFASGQSSLRFDIPGKSDANMAGQWWQDFGGSFGANATFWVQFKQRFSSEWTTLDWDKLVGSSFKQVIFHYYDATCATVELTTGRYAWANPPSIPIMYTECGARGLDTNGGNPPTLFQQGDYQCAYGNINATDCFEYPTDTWVTFTWQVAIGDWGQPNSHVVAWVQPEGQPAKRFIDLPGFVLNNDTPGNDYDHLTLTPYMTRKDATVDHPTAHTWYDDLIVSSQPIGALTP